MLSVAVYGFRPHSGTAAIKLDQQYYLHKRVASEYIYIKILPGTGNDGRIKTHLLVQSLKGTRIFLQNISDNHCGLFFF